MSVTIAVIPSKIASAPIAAEIAKMIEFLKKTENLSYETKIEYVFKNIFSKLRNKRYTF